MNITSLKAVLISICLIASANAFSNEKTTSESKLKAIQIEKEVNLIFTRALSAAATKLDTDREMAPFAMILKQDDTVGFFEIESSQAKTLSVNQQVFQIRKYLTEMALDAEIKASTIAQYVAITDGKKTNQGISFEVEHLEGVALLRMIPVTEKENEGKASTIVLHTESISTSVKHAMVFTDMAKSISRQN